MKDEEEVEALLSCRWPPHQEVSLCLLRGGNERATMAHKTSKTHAHAWRGDVKPKPANPSLLAPPTKYLPHVTSQPVWRARKLANVQPLQ